MSKSSTAMSDYSPSSKCPGCKYDLKGLQLGRVNRLTCPECKSQFDPTTVVTPFNWLDLNSKLVIFFTLPSILVPILTLTLVHSLAFGTWYTVVAIFFWPALLITVLCRAYIKHLSISTKPPSIPLLLLSGMLISIPGMFMHLLLFIYFIAGASSV